MEYIKSVQDIQSLLMNVFDNWQDFGEVSVRSHEALKIFNYTSKAQFEGRWNFFERISRGLILNSQTGEVVARPFDKFFNWGEGGRSTNAPIRNIMEKMDGSLGILYRDNGHCRIATRGRFDSEQAFWASEFLDQNCNLSALPVHLTLIFEIIYPDNEIIVDYQGREDLVLLAARNRFNGEYSSWRVVSSLAYTFGFSLPQVYQFGSADHIKAACDNLDANSEGWVAEFEDGQRYKFKGNEYRRLHRLINGLSFKRTLDYVANDSLVQLRLDVPDKFLAEVDKWVGEIQITVQKIESEVDEAFSHAPKETRKDFAIWVATNHKSIAPYMFARFDSRSIRPFIYKMAFK